MNIGQIICSDIEESVKKAGLGLVSPITVTYPTNNRFGDYTTNWPLQVAGKLKQSPEEVAKKIQIGLRKSDVYDPPEFAAPGFINFKLRQDFLIKHLKLTLAEGDMFGSNSSGRGKKVLIEYSSPNIAKPMHIGHLRNTNIGIALDKIISFNGYQTITENHIGDWGTQFGKLIYAYKVWGKDLTDPTIKDLLDLYVRFHEEASKDPKLEDAGREEFRKLESGDEENRRLWEQFRKISLEEFDRLYRELGARFNYQHGESFYEKELPKVVDQALKAGVAKKDPDGSVVIPLEGMPPFLILKSDGATLYGTRDLATAKYRIEEFSPNKALYIVGSEQALYFHQLFASLKKLGWGNGVEWEHISYGLTKLPQGKLSTRSGELVTAEEIIAEAKERAAKVVSEKDSSKLPDKSIVEAVAIGAIKWNDLRVTRESEVLFDWNQIFNFEGNSGPYIQYSYARTQSILAKGRLESSSWSGETLRAESETALLRQLVRFPEVVEQAAATYSPHLICQYAFELAQSFSRFYESQPVLSAPAAERLGRLALVTAVGQNLQICLSLLGISAPTKL